jgi:methylmalonyl-CoA mutase N-terminal domain/subunit
VPTPIASPGTRVTSASARGEFSRVQGVSATTTSGEWIWKQVTKCVGATPSARAMRARFSRTFSGLSFEADPAVQAR